MTSVRLITSSISMCSRMINIPKDRIHRELIMKARLRWSKRKRRKRRRRRRLTERRAERRKNQGSRSLSYLATVQAAPQPTLRALVMSWTSQTMANNRVSAMMTILIASSSSMERGSMRVARWTMDPLTKALNLTETHKMQEIKTSLLI